MRLLLAVFLLRALVPLGFMPDLGALGEGRFEIVVCTPSGTKTLTVDAEGQPVEQDDRDGAPAKSAADCPFGTAVAKALALPEPLVAAAFAAPFRADFPAPLARNPQAPALGPPLGQRAPPVLLG